MAFKHQYVTVKQIVIHTRTLATLLDFLENIENGAMLYCTMYFYSNAFFQVSLLKTHDGILLYNLLHYLVSPGHNVKNNSPHSHS